MDLNLKKVSLLRHSVRNYLDQEVEHNLISKLEEKVQEVNNKSGLNIEITLNERLAMAGFEPRLANANNYLVMKGNALDPKLKEKVGYYGEELVLFLTSLNLGSLWVAGSLHPDKVQYKKIDEENMVLIIAFGHCKDFGKAHISKSLNELSNLDENSPLWFKKGVEEVALAPSAMNMQNYYFKYIDEDKVEVSSKPARWAKVDKGIAIYHFEIGSERKIINL